MLSSVRRRLTYANVTATLALFLALTGGVVYAASKIGTADLRNGAVTAQKIKGDAVSSRKIRPGGVEASDLAPGTAGPLGYAYFSDGILDPERSGNIEASNVVVVSEPPAYLTQFCFVGLPFQPNLVLATLGFDVFVPPNGSVESRAVKAQLGSYQGCPSGSVARVVVDDDQGRPIGRANFSVAFFG